MRTSLVSMFLNGVGGLHGNKDWLQGNITLVGFPVASSVGLLNLIVNCFYISLNMYITFELFLLKILLKVFSLLDDVFESFF